MPKTRRFACDYKGRQQDISVWVYKQMQLKNINQTELADQLDITQQKVSEKLSLKNNNWFSLIELMKLFDVFKTDDKEIVKLFRV